MGWGSSNKPEVSVVDPKTKPQVINVDAPPSAPSSIQDDLLNCGGQLSLGTVCGYASGYAMRTVGKIAAFTLGSGFIILQSLQYMGYVNVNWKKVEKDYVRFMDLDGDGQITYKDAAIALDKFKDVLIFDLPAGAGFTAGWMYGLGGTAKLAGGVAGAGALAGVGARVLLPRVVATAGATTGGPALLVEAKKWLYPDPAPEQVYQATLTGYNHKDLTKLLKSVDQQLGKKKLSSVELETLQMQKRVIAKQIEKLPTPPVAPAAAAASSKKSWWRFW